MCPRRSAPEEFDRALTSEELEEEAQAGPHHVADVYRQAPRGVPDGGDRLPRCRRESCCVSGGGGDQREGLSARLWTNQ